VGRPRVQPVRDPARPVRRVLVAAAVLFPLVAVAVIIATTSSGGTSAYQVRAVFDDASFAVPGEDVRIAGAPVGTIASLDLTNTSGLGGPNSCKRAAGTCKAAVTLSISAPGFTPFRQNATCSIRPQSLIGEKYVDCTPGTSGAPPLHKITQGPGAGTYLLPVTNTSSPIDTDLVQNIYREPVRQWFGLIINEFGTGLAARGTDLNEVIHRANPALGYTDQVLKILAKQNKQLAQLATDSDTVLTPLAKEQQTIKQWVLSANTTSVATATQAVNTARSFHLLPSFLQQLRPLLSDLGALADQATPVLNASAEAAPALALQNEALANPFRATTGFADIARQSLISLGNAADKQAPLLLSTIPLDRQLLALGTAGLPAFTNLDKLTSSLFQTGAVEQLVRLLFNGTSAVNGFDADGHYIRTEALVGSCTGYAKITVPGCSANFTHQTTSEAADIAKVATQPKLVKMIKAAHSSGLQSNATKTLGGLMRYLIGPGG
jgi:phospholipid/cholesterol/gamma-HCH transport system substrate-binding protein